MTEQRDGTSDPMHHLSHFNMEGDGIAHTLDGPRVNHTLAIHSLTHSIAVQPKETSLYKWGEIWHTTGPHYKFTNVG